MISRMKVNPTEHELDLALAAELQAALLPTECPSGCPHQQAAALNRMCGTVGGDFHDFIRLNEDQFVVVIGDVVGHGVRAALLMAKILGFLRSRPDVLARPVETMAVLNRMLIELGDRTGSVMPCSMFYGLMDAPTGLALFVNAGHPAPFLCSRTECTALHLGPRNILLGVEDYTPKEACHTFVPGERLVLYTDGLLDAVDPAGERFGADRLHEVVCRSAESPPDQCARAVFDAVEQFRHSARQMDDETIVVLDRL